MISRLVISRSWDSRSPDYTFSAALEVHTRFSLPLGFVSPVQTFAANSGLRLPYHGLGALLDKFPRPIRPDRPNDGELKRADGDEHVSNDEPDYLEDGRCRACMFLVWSLRNGHGIGQSLCSQEMPWNWLLAPVAKLSPVRYRAYRLPCALSVHMCGISW